ncbi:predicted protein [Phaeodactylum tricornutum CCAP 1055/1]|jgi:prolyl 4-hydroxylase|uniref:ShKT domain-containing protein n=2 Tax=Phaeodactylum tricornutum TaxID=2850 RepID=B7G869_PHATC|nr:predicted protein [Phaeodactylum tricornutum CCAP 1055/1]EEC44990.1 predicted protein [Phaeodactylum tricornutum CCAP 1055/1]|eukprot:XP_002183290.1 predicted protein [Phaeodactylum tricornutum CCAP 1055/1]
MKITTSTITTTGRPTRLRPIRGTNHQIGSGLRYAWWTLWTYVLLASATDVPPQQQQTCVVDATGSDQVCTEESVASGMSSTCEDLHPDCDRRAGHDDCVLNYPSMKTTCAHTCQLCDPAYYYWSAISTAGAAAASTTSPTSLEGSVLEKATISIQNVYDALAQTVQGPEPQRETTLARLQQTHQYMDRMVYGNETLQDVWVNCMNRHELCTFWASLGECDANPTYMKLQCAPACNTCDELSFDLRCPMPADDELLEAKNAWATSANTRGGDLNGMFKRIVTDPDIATKHQPTVHSAPMEHWESRDTLTNTTTEVHDDGPWVVSLEDFLTPEECAVMIQLGGDQGYEQSKDVGEQKFDGTYAAVTSNERTSTNAWCVGACDEHPVVQTIHQRMESLLNIPAVNYEHLQLLRYEETQFYGNHHDFIPFHVGRRQGPRILTVFLYLNDVEEGGGTHFALLNLVRVENVLGLRLQFEGFCSTLLTRFCGTFTAATLDDYSKGGARRDLAQCQG